MCMYIGGVCGCVGSYIGGVHMCEGSMYVSIPRNGAWLQWAVAVVAPSGVLLTYVISLRSSHIVGCLK